MIKRTRHSRPKIEMNMTRERWNVLWRIVRLRQGGKHTYTPIDGFKFEELVMAQHCMDIRNRRFDRPLKERLMRRGWMKGWEEHNVSRWN